MLEVRKVVALWEEVGGLGVLQMFNYLEVGDSYTGVFTLGKFTELVICELRILLCLCYTSIKSFKKRKKNQLHDFLLVDLVGMSILSD